MARLCGCCLVIFLSSLAAAALLRGRVKLQVTTRPDPREDYMCMGKPPKPKIRSVWYQERRYDAKDGRYIELTGHVPDNTLFAKKKDIDSLVNRGELIPKELQEVDRGELTRKGLQEVPLAVYKGRAEGLIQVEFPDGSLETRRQGEGELAVVADDATTQSHSPRRVVYEVAEGHQLEFVDHFGNPVATPSGTRYIDPKDLSDLEKDGIITKKADPVELAVDGGGAGQRMPLARPHQAGQVGARVPEEKATPYVYPQPQPQRRADEDWTNPILYVWSPPSNIIGLGRFEVQ